MRPPRATSSTNYLRILRLRERLTQRQVAERVGADQRTVSTWERGACPSTAHLIALAQLFGVDSKRLRSRLLRAAWRRGDPGYRTEAVSAPCEFWLLVRAAALAEGEDPDEFLVDRMTMYLKLERKAA